MRGAHGSSPLPTQCLRTWRPARTHKSAAKTRPCVSWFSGRQLGRRSYRDLSLPWCSTTWRCSKRCKAARPPSQTCSIPQQCTTRQQHWHRDRAIAARGRCQACQDTGCSCSGHSSLPRQGSCAASPPPTLSSFHCESAAKAWHRKSCVKQLTCFAASTCTPVSWASRALPHCEPSREPHPPMKLVLLSCLEERFRARGGPLGPEGSTGVGM